MADMAGHGGHGRISANKNVIIRINQTVNGIGITSRS